MSELFVWSEDILTVIHTLLEKKVFMYSAQNLKSRFSLQAVSVNFTLKNECRYL